MFGSTSGKRQSAFVVPQRTLFDFVSTRDLSGLKELIDSNPQAVVADRDKHGYSALHIAAACGHEDLCKALLGVEEQHVALTMKDSPSSSPKKGARSAASSASAAGRTASNKSTADGESGNAVGVDPLASSTNRRSKSTSGKERLPGNSALNPTQLPVPVRLPTVLSNVNATSNCGYTALHIAAMRGNTAIVKLLLELGADPTLITRGIPNEPLTAYQLARKHKHPAIEYLLEPLTLLGCKAITKDGSRDAAQQYVASIDPLQAAEAGDVLYFSLALLDMCSDGGAVNAQQYQFGMDTLNQIRTAVCDETGRNALMIALDRDDLAAADHDLIVDLLTEPIVFVRKSGRKPEESLESVFVAGPKYPSWDTYRLGGGFSFPIGLNGAPIKPYLISEHLDAVKKRRGPSDGDEIDDAATEAHDTTIPNHNDGAGTNGEEGGAGNDSTGLIYSINAQNHIGDGYSALHYAVRRGHIKIAMRLVTELGADATITTSADRLLPADMADDLHMQQGTGSLIPTLKEAAVRKTFLDTYNKRNDVYPDDRAAFSENAKELKRKWRDADKFLKGEAVKEGADASADDMRGNYANYSGDGTETEGYASPARGDGTVEPSSPRGDGDPRGNIDGPTPAPE